MSKKFIEDNKGPYPVYSSQTENNGELGRISTYNIDGEYLTWTTDGANAGSVFYRTGKFSITNVCGLLKVKDKSVLSARFLYYVLQTATKAYVNQGMGNPKLMSNVMATVKIPLPPLEVQKEIARILDKFATLEAELEAELEARRKQYQFYREQLLNFKSNTPPLSRILGEVCDIRNGYTPSKAKGEYWQNGTIPWFVMEDIRKNGRVLSDSIQHITREAVKGGRLFLANSIILATSATVGEHALITVDHLSNQRFVNLKIKDSYKDAIDLKYLFYYMFVVDEWCKNNVNVSGFASVDMTKFRKLQIPVPPLSEQKRIVEILDKFSTLIDDISSGLPAEIKMRHQQYEYYRDKLLTFKQAA